MSHSIKKRKESLTKAKWKIWSVRWGDTPQHGKIPDGGTLAISGPYQPGQFFFGINCLEHHGFVDSHRNLGYPLVDYD